MRQITHGESNSRPSKTLPILSDIIMTILAMNYFTKMLIILHGASFVYYNLIIPTTPVRSTLTCRNQARALGYMKQA